MNTYSKVLIPASILILAIALFGWKIFLLLIGFAGGFLWGLPDEQPERRPDIGRLITELFEAQTSKLDRETRNQLDAIRSGSILSISPSIDEALDRIIVRLSKDLLHPWFTQLNKSLSDDFRVCVEITLRTVIFNLVELIKASPPDFGVLFMYCLTESLTTHMVM